MRAAQWLEPERLEVAEVDEPVVGPGQAIVDVACCGICGSDLHAWRGGVGVRPGQILGHEFAGRVVEADSVDGLAPGDRVTVRPLTPCGRCDRCRRGDIHLCEAGVALNIGYGTPGGFAERVLVPRAIVGQTVFHLPDTVDDQAGSLVEPLAVALRAARHARPGPGDVAVVSGTGAVGLAVIHWLKTMGASHVIAVEPSDLRREKALAFGADEVVDPSVVPVDQAVAHHTGPGAHGLGARADVVVECSGAARAFVDALKIVRGGGRVVIAALYEDRVEFRPDRIVEKELEIRGSFAYRDEFPIVIAELERGSFDTARFISHTFPLDRIGDAFTAQADASASIKVMVTPHD